MNWNDARISADRLYSILRDRNVIDATMSVYGGNLHEIIGEIFKLAFVADFNRKNPDILLLLQYYEDHQ